MKLEIIKKAIELIVLLVTMWISVEVMVIGMALCTLVFTFVNAYPNIKLLGYSFKEQMRDIIPSTGASFVMAVIVLVIGRLPMEKLPLLVFQVLIGMLIYFGLAVITRNKEFEYLVRVVKKLLTKKNSA